MYDVSGFKLLMVYVSEVIRWAATTHPVSRSELKLSMV